MVVVTGGRRYERRDTVFGVLDEHHERHPIRLLVQGGATGADTFAKEWAKARGIPCVTEDAEWDKYGRPAGYIRNEQMINDYCPRWVISFPGGKGTLHCTRYAYRAGCKVREINGEAHGRW